MKLIQFQVFTERTEGSSNVVAIIALDDEGQLYYRHRIDGRYVWTKMKGPFDAKSE